MDTFRELSTKSIDELNKLSSDYINFDSKEKKYIEMNEACEKLTSREEFNELLKKYSNSVELVGDEIEIADKTIYDRFIPDIDRPYFYIGEMIQIYKNGEQITIMDGDLNKVQPVLSGEKDLLSVARARISGSHSKFRAINASCQYMEASFTTHNNYKGISWANSYSVGNVTGLVINGKYQYRMYVSTNTGGQVRKKTFGIWHNKNTDKTVYRNHTINAYLDGVQVINEPQDAVSTINGSYENRVFTDEESSPLIYLLEDELDRYTVSLTEGTGRLSSSSLSGASVWYKCP